MSAWSDFKKNPSVSTYLDWVRGSYGEYAEALEEQDAGLGTDVAVLAGAAAGMTLGAAKEALEESLDVGGKIANATLDVVRGLGGAIVDGLDSAYDAARGKLEGREPDVIAGIVVVALTVLTVTYIYHSAKVAGDAF